MALNSPHFGSMRRAVAVAEDGEGDEEEEEGEVVEQ